MVSTATADELPLLKAYEYTLRTPPLATSEIKDVSIYGPHWDRALASYLEIGQGAGPLDVYNINRSKVWNGIDDMQKLDVTISFDIAKFHEIADHARQTDPVLADFSDAEFARLVLIGQAGGNVPPEARRRGDDLFCLFGIWGCDPPPLPPPSSSLPPSEASFEIE